MRWKLLGLAGVAGVTASGAVVARRGREHAELEPDALRDRLHERLAQTRTEPGAADPEANRLPSFALNTEDAGRSAAPSDGSA